MSENGNGRRRWHHEEYESVFGSASAVAMGAVAAGERYVSTTAGGGADPLRGHAGTGENLYLAWNGVPDDLAEIDVVVHLHGYQMMDPTAALLRHKVRMSGLRLDGRARPTLGIVPRGRRITEAEYQAALADFKAGRRRNEPRRDTYTFPAVVAGSGAGLEALITWALAWFGREVLRRAAPRTARLILTAHSGGGSPLSSLLAWRGTRAACNPHEVHVFDALYGGADTLRDWARERIAADRALPAGELAVRGGGLRILYGGGTRAASEAVGGTLPRAGDALRDAYRAEATTFGHNDIPGTFGPGLLRDVRATLALRPAAARGHGVEEDADPVEDAEPAYAGGGFADVYGGLVGGYGYVESLAVDDDVRAWLAAVPAARAPLSAAVAAWIADTGRSGIELIADAARRRHFLSGVDWSRTDFPGNDQNRSAEPTALFDALAAPVPERRVTSIRYHDVDAVVQPVPGETSFRLYPEAKDAYVRMRDAARAAGVTLRIGSAWRSLAAQRGLAAKNPNGNAVAQRVSAHCYGLAIDLLLGVPGLSIREITTRPMSNVIAMYRSPVYKWMALHAREFGFFPYRREPWHWEYNPAGFQARFESSGTTASAHAYGAPLGLFERYPSAAALETGTVPLFRDDGAFALQAAPAAPRDWTAASADERLRYVMERLVDHYGFPVNGAAGLVGNLWAESGVLPSRIEGSAPATPMRAPAFTGGARDFTADEVMNRDRAAQRGPRLPGIGLAQWTSAARRAGLFRHSFGGNVLGSAILFDMDAQVDYLVTELRASYAGVHRLLTRPTVTVNDAADEVVYRFEVPGSVLEDGRLLPRTDSRVQAVFTERRAAAQRALRAYRAAHPATGVSQQAPPALDFCTLGQTVATIALRELADWTRGGAPIPESDPGRLPALERYWGAVPGASAAAAARASARDDANFPWSAAFICYVMSQAGVRRAHGFEFAGAHIHYIVGALRNRERSDPARPFWLLDTIEMQNEITVQPGDLLCMNREAGGRMTTHSYETLRRAFWRDGTTDRSAVRPSGSSHCTIVVRIGQDAQGRFAETVGGNEQNTVRLNRYGRIALNAAGGIANPAAHNIFGLIRNTGCRT